MKGLVFTLLQEFVEENHGFAAWNAILDRAETSCDGIFIATETYPDSDLFKIADAASALIKTNVADIFEAFGVYSFPKLVMTHPNFLKEAMTLKEFIKSVDNVIHVEVRKLNPEASLPKLAYQDSNSDRLTLLYQSERKLCHFAIGLLKGAALHFQSSVKIGHTQCMHDGHDNCVFELEFTEAP